MARAVDVSLYPFNIAAGHDAIAHQRPAATPALQCEIESLFILSF